MKPSLASNRRTDRYQSKTACITGIVAAIEDQASRPNAAERNRSAGPIV
ncbi:MAG: hypothetical protein ISP43_00085 [Candidatus Puniceispirillum sp.]|nr:hypothetical protein [Candidatus Puniceispirillum sp.]MBL6774119.1 hypothetical protein [Candidatus Puniceispirillum sp.]